MGFHDTNVFFSYAHEDDEYRIQLQEHLKLFERMGVISCWHDRGIIAGEEWEDSISSNLKAADIILALVSSAFLASEYCYGRELKRALSQHASGQSRLIPIIIRPVVWSDSALGKLQALPDNAKPVSTWSDRDAAWANVVRGIKRAVDTIKTQKQDFLRYIP